MSTQNTPQNPHDDQSLEATATLTMHPERELIRPQGSKRHIEFAIKVQAPTVTAPSTRTPVQVSLVLDRSGSMSGEKIRIAKQTALLILRHLDERDRVAVTVFDDRIDVIQPATAVTPEQCAAVEQALQRVEARGSTALHEGWLKGCETIAGDGSPQTGDAVARCFLFTDGQANIGETDTERISTQATSIREKTGISTSTFGIGEDYNEHLLGPMAVAGDGQFHHIRTMADFVTALSGEIGDLLLVSIQNLRLEIEVKRGLTAEVISDFRHQASSARREVMTVSIGDLATAEERHVVVRFAFPRGDMAYQYPVRARLVWAAHGHQRTGEWQTVTFTHSSDADCDAEQPNRGALHYIGLAHAALATKRAIELQQRGELQLARDLLTAVTNRIAGYAEGDVDLIKAIQELRDLVEKMEYEGLSPMTSKEAYFKYQTRSRGQKYYRDDDNA